MCPDESVIIGKKAVVGYLMCHFIGVMRLGKAVKSEYIWCPAETRFVYAKQLLSESHSSRHSFSNHGFT